ncbi:MAG: hypothetical protein ACRCUT_00785, partial [Spirochaetota bacterium]
ALSEGRDDARSPICSSAGKRVVSLWMQGGRIRGKFSDISVDPPSLRSRTHPDGAWVKTSDALIEWDAAYDESGVAGFASLLSKDSDTNPTVQNLNSNTRSERIRSIGDGITWYHIRAIDGSGNYSRTIHYPLRISRTPLPIPAVEAPGHPEGKSSNDNTPQFTWQITDIERVKGFFYSLGKDAPVKPSIFTDKMTASFSALDEGRYFFRIQAVDKTGMPGRAADYEFIIGRALELSPEKYEQLAAQADTEEKTEQEKIIPRFVFREPRCSIEIPSGDGAWPEKDITVTVKTYAGKNVAFDSFEYDLMKDNRKIQNGASGVPRIILKNLSDGSYTVAVRGNYSYIRNGRKKTGTTRLASGAFSVAVPTSENPLVLIARMLSGRGAAEFPVIVIALFLASGALLFKFNARLAFSLYRIRYRFSSRLRLIFSFLR